MAALPKRWWHGSFCSYEMLALPTRWWLYPQDAYKMATVPRFCEFYPQDGDEAVLPTRWQRYEQDGGFTHKTAVYLQNDNVYASFTQRSDSCDN